MMTSRNNPVLVVGAGPSGLAAALGLATRGVAVRIIDRSREGTNTSRAAVVHAATLEALAPVGATEAILARAIAVPRFEVRDGSKPLARLSFGDLPSDYRFTAMIPQSQTEAVLRERLAEEGVRVDWESELVTLDETGGTVTAGIRQGQQIEQVESTLVIGADGSHSRTRELVGIAFQGSAYDEDFVLADVEMPWPLGRDTVSLTFARSGLLVVAPLPGGSFRVVATADDPPEKLTIGDIEAIIGARAGHVEVEQVAWSGRFRVSHRLAAAYRVGRVFLLGDAAHVHSPAGGQGMNLGIRDALVLADLIASGADLDDYERRRRPLAQRVISATDRMTRAATVRGGPQRLARNALVGGLTSIPAVQRRLTMELSGLAYE